MEDLCSDSVDLLFEKHKKLRVNTAKKLEGIYKREIELEETDLVLEPLETQIKEFMKRKWDVAASPQSKFYIEKEKEFEKVELADFGIDRNSGLNDFDAGIESQDRAYAKKNKESRNEEV